MHLTPVDLAEQTPDLIKYLASPGLLLVVPDTQRQANVMTIGWATYGRIWAQPICVVLVRPSRYTYSLINRAGVFTVNLMAPGNEEAIARCGTASGRDVDKIAEQGWTIGTGSSLAVPFIEQAALHLECRTVFKGKVTPELDPALLSQCYPRGDLHDIYFGQVTGIFRHDA